MCILNVLLLGLLWRLIRRRSSLRALRRGGRYSAYGRSLLVADECGALKMPRRRTACSIILCTYLVIGVTAASSVLVACFQL